MIRVRCLSGVAADVRAEVRRLAVEFAAVSPVRHTINVTVCPHPAVSSPDGNMVGFGVFGAPPRRSEPCRVGIAAGMADEYHKHGGTRRHAVRAVGECFLHELAHYEQFRDRRPLTERGVEARARKLYLLIDPPPVAPPKGK